MTIAVVPVKNLDRAKNRLAARLGAAERRTLVLLMLEDILQTLRRVPAISGIMVVTREGEVASRAERLGAEILDEPANDGYSSAVGRASVELGRRGAPAMLVVPGDVPGVTADEITAILSAARAAPSLVLVPSRNDCGTNAALVTPPGSFDLRYGEPSFAAHVARARERGLPTEVVRLPGIGLDLDNPEDLDAFLREPTPTATFYFLLDAIGGRATSAESPLPTERTS